MGNCFNKYYIPLPLVEIKDNKPFSDQLVKKQTRSIWKTYPNIKKW